MAMTKTDALRARMAAAGMDAYIVPTADFHESEYVGAHFKSRAHLTGFTGSAGVCVVTQKGAGLWTDGRYFIQAAAQLQGSGIDLMKSGEPDVPTIEEYLAAQLPQGGVLGFDGRVINTRMALGLQKALKNKDVQLIIDGDLVGDIWQDRPALSAQPAFRLTMEQAGVSAEDKIAVLREDIAKEGATVALLPGLDDIAWLLNIRGNDIDYNPYLLSFAAVTAQNTYLFAQDAALPDDVRASLEDDGVTVMPYDQVYAFIASLPADSVALLDSGKLNYAAYSRVPQGVRIIDKISAITLLKAVKNPVEIENLRRSHLKDGVAVTKFMHWVKTQVGKQDIDEIAASDYLQARREEQQGYIELSFDTICAYNANAAMMHYSAQPESAAQLAPEGLLLVDSGGQYIDGTTDITRTLVLGPVCDEWKTHYTAVLRGMINLSRARFLYGCKGLNLDILARGPVWDANLDYKCGTGHGVGFIGGVHESPNGFRWRSVPERNDGCVLEAGMVTTNEPGVYIEGSHGIRIENELLCCKGEKNEYGQFMHFEVLTFAPIDLDAVIAENMTAQEREYLNEYHRQVFHKLSPFMDEQQTQWLRTNTRAI